MPLAPRTLLGPYEIVAPAGSGGMGEVYRARDTRLGRDVAVKVLPPSVASDPELRQRMEREARAISALSHPHICSLYDVGHDRGLDFLVMEFLEGETLAGRLSRGPLAPDQVLRHGIEIAGALHAAHRRGFAHRDLKPGNVMLTRGGAKLLDFGLAKPLPAPAGLPGAASATGSAPLTAEGSFVGTIQYMSPEQLEGREADARSDIFALGAVLYEMATGQRAFQGASTASVIAAILERHPPAISTLQPLAPAALDDLARGCLAKDPDERWQTAHDVRLQLQSIAQQAARGAAAAPPSPRRGLREWMPWVVAAAALVLAIALGIAAANRGGASDPAAPHVVRASLLPPAGHSFSPNDFAISPDGRRVAFIATSADGVATLWIGPLDSPQPAEITGSEEASSPFWSPDSRAVAFFARGQLWKVEPGVTGVEPVTAATQHAGGGAWGAGDEILFANAVLGPLMRVPARGGTAVPATAVPDDAPGEAHRFPQFLPDGRRFLYAASWTTKHRGGIYLGSLDGSAPVLVASDIEGRVLLAGTQLVFLDGDTIYAQPFDVHAGALMGTRRVVLRGELAEDWRFGHLPVSVSQTGIMLFQSRLSYNSRLVWYDRKGRELGPVGPPGYSSPDVSPDQRWIAVTFDSAGNGGSSVWLYDRQRGVPAQLTRDGIDTALSWSGDSRWIAYSSQRATTGLFRRRADRSAPEERLLESPAHLLVTGCSPDGRRVLYMDFRAGVPELRTYDVETRRSELIDYGAEGSYSPDGQWISYLTVPAAMTLIIRPARGGGAPITVTSSGASQARWRSDSREIFYIAPDKKLMAVPLTLRDGQLEAGAATALFQTRIVSPRLVLFQYDVTPDGQQFLVNSLPREDAAAPLSMLINWTREIAR